MFHSRMLMGTPSNCSCERVVVLQARGVPRSSYPNCANCLICLAFVLGWLDILMVVPLPGLAGNLFFCLIPLALGMVLCCQKRVERLADAGEPPSGVKMGGTTRGRWRATNGKPLPKLYSCWNGLCGHEALNRMVRGLPPREGPANHAGAETSHGMALFGIADGACFGSAFPCRI